MKSSVHDKHKLGDRRIAILDAALALVEGEGVSALTQPRIARAAGLRQSHLTYYFPRRADLLAAMMARSHEHAHHHHGEGHPDEGEPYSSLARLIFDRQRAKFFLTVIVGTADDPESRAIVDAHMEGFTRHVAHIFGRPADDAAIHAFVAQLRGLTLIDLMAASPEPDPVGAIKTAARSLGLAPQAQL